MSRSSNVIDLEQRRKGRKLDQKSAHTQGEVFDMTMRRQAILSSERREVKRTILSEFIGAFIVLPEKGLSRVSVYDISENGIAFDIDEALGGYHVGEEVAMRVYLNQSTYFPFVVSVANVRKVSEEGVVRHGCNFIKETVNAEALTHFVKFIETVSASLRTDHGDVMVSHIGR